MLQGRFLVPRDDWYADIESAVFSYNEYFLTKTPGAEFPGLFCTTNDKNTNFASFPCLMVKEISQEEIGNDLDNSTVNAVRSTFECRAYALSDDECRRITVAQSKLMKALRFNAVMLPEHSQEGETHVSIARYRRVIGAGDKDIAG